MVLNVFIYKVKFIDVVSQDYYHGRSLYFRRNWQYLKCLFTKTNSTAK